MKEKLISVQRKLFKPFLFYFMFMVIEVKITTIRLTEKTKKELEKLKYSFGKKLTYDELISILVNFYRTFHDKMEVLKKSPKELETASKGGSHARISCSNSGRESDAKCRREMSY